MVSILAPKPKNVCGGGGAVWCVVRVWGCGGGGTCVACVGGMWGTGEGVWCVMGVWNVYVCSHIQACVLNVTVLLFS